MKYINLLFIAILLTFMACKTDSSGGAAAGDGTVSTDLAALEKEVNEKTTPENTQKLLAAYTAEIAKHPEDADANSKILYRAAQLQFRNNRHSAAADLLKQAIKNHYTGSNTDDNAMLLGAIYGEKLQNKPSALTVYQAFLRAFPEHENKDVIAKKVPSGTLALEERIADLGKQMYNEKEQKVDYKVVNDFINCCELYAMMLPDSPQSPDMLHKAGEAARSIRSFPKALDMYEWIDKKYADSPKGPQAMFLRAFTLDNDMKKYDEAKVVYEAFLKKYPNDDFADDTKFLLQNLGKTDEEIINSFSEKK